MRQRAASRLIGWLMAVLHGGLAVLGFHLHHLAGISHRFSLPSGSGLSGFCGYEAVCLKDPKDRPDGVLPPPAYGPTARLCPCGPGAPDWLGNLLWEPKAFSAACWGQDRDEVQTSRRQKAAEPAAAPTHDLACCPICQYLVQPKWAAPSLSAPPKTLLGGMPQVPTVRLVCQLPIWAYQPRAPPIV